MNGQGVGNRKSTESQGGGTNKKKKKKGHSSEDNSRVTNEVQGGFREKGKSRWRLGNAWEPGKKKSQVQRGGKKPRSLPVGGTVDRLKPRNLGYSNPSPGRLQRNDPGSLVTRFVKKKKTLQKVNFNDKRRVRMQRQGKTVKREGGRNSWRLGDKAGQKYSKTKKAEKKI